MTSKPRLLAALAVAVILVTGCGSDGGTSSPATASSTVPVETTGAVATTQPPTTTAPATTDAPTIAPTTTEVGEPLQILVTNDDGVGAPGIDALVNALSELDDIEITVVAPAENQSGTSMSLTDGDVNAAPATTASGVEATAVVGFPADAVRWALENLDVDVDLVVSGSNSAQNIGDFSMLSGTVGAARYAAQQGIPAMAVSQGLPVEGGDIDFDDSVATAVALISDRRADIEAGLVTLTSINSPTCPDGARGVVEVPLGAFEGRDPFAFDCASTLADPVDDVDAFANGFTAVTDLPIQV